MIVHTGAARKTITLDDGSVWSWKFKEQHWLSGMDFPVDRLVDGDAEWHAQRDEPFHYNDWKPLTAEERAGIAAIIAGTTHEL